MTGAQNGQTDELMTGSTKAGQLQSIGRLGRQFIRQQSVILFPDNAVALAGALF
jgi:hypothetical protein